MKPKQISHKNTSVKIPSEDLKIGMHVSQLDRPWLDTPFLLQGFPINNPDDLKALKTICDYVYIDILKSEYLDPNVRSKPIKNSKRKSYKVTESIETEIQTAQPTYHRSLAEIKRLLANSFKDEALDTQKVRAYVRDCVDSIERNPSAMIWLTRIKHVDEYTAEHCLNVGLLAIALGRHMGLSRKHLELLGLCGMLHDVGKMQVDQNILNKPDRLTPAEFEHIKHHALFGRVILEKDHSLPTEVIRAAYEHHERLDGKGYPQGLNAGQLGFYTKVVSVVDAYDAIVSKRCYSNGMTSATALKILYKASGLQFDAQLVVKFIECIGIYPPGSVVEMASGEVGVVLSADPDNRLLPKIALLLDVNKYPMQQYIIDLKAQRQSGSGRQHHIKTVLVSGSYGIDLEKFTQDNINFGTKQTL